MSVKIAVRIPDELHAEIDAAAKAEGIKFSQMIIAMLREDTRPSKVVAVLKPERVAKTESAKAIKPAEKPKTDKCPHGYETKRMCNFRGGGCSPW